MIDDLWYKNSIIYSLDVDTFMDGNGDGVGDFHGLVERLDYLDSLGVDVIWLAPFQPSPNRDNGYDVSDYYGVDPRYGSSGDFVEFVQHAKKRGMRVILDLVVNHTSNQHPWFKNARSSPDSPYRDWYVWSKRRPAGWNKGMVFPGVQKRTWSRDRVAGAWYHHRFYDFQPDLNMHNPEVRAEIRRVMGYWLQLGVNGFRLDAVPFIIELSRRSGNGLMRYDYITEMRQFLQWRTGDAAILGEANVLPDATRKYFGDGRDCLNMMFNFYVNQHLFYALAS
jgi:maltose alpha-D-glucosyltransferase / alpha-amylase